MKGASLSRHHLTRCLLSARESKVGDLDLYEVLLALHWLGQQETTNGRY